MYKAIEVLLNHKSIRKFTDSPVDDETIDKIISCAQMAPSSSHIQAYTIIEVKSTEKRELLYEISGNQKWLLSAPVVLLFCGDLHRGSMYYEDMDQEILTNTELFTVATIDTALVAQRALIAAQTLGLGGVFVGGIRNGVEIVSREFGLPDLVFPLFALCLGYPDENPGLKPRLPQKVIRKTDYYDETLDSKLIAEYDETVSRYYVERTKGKEDDTWTLRSSKYLKAKPRYNVGEHFRKIGLLKK